MDEKTGFALKSVFIYVLAMVVACAPPDQNPKADQPNIVLILTDDQGWGDLSVHGNTNLSTPHIDRLASDGARFDRFFVCAVCSPTRAEILTGRYAARSGVTATSQGKERIDLDEETIAEILQANGYHTGAFGKWHNGMQYPYHPNARGFDEYYGFCSGHWGNYFDPMLEHNGKIVQGKGFIIDDLTDKALDFIEQHHSAPFFVYLPYNTPHSPMQVPDRWWDKFADLTLNQFHREPDKERISHTKAALALVENIDWNVGRVMDKLADLKLVENTIVIYLSDNGPNGFRWNDGMKGRKGSTDEGGVRSPMILQWKTKVAPGKVIPQIASSIDFLPTLVDLTNSVHQPDREIDGISLAPLLLEEEPQWQDRVIINQWRDRISARSQDFRLDHEGQLFHMVTDPGQHTNVASKNPEVLRRLTDASKQFRENIYSQLPAPDTRPFPLGHPDYRYTQMPARDALPTGQIKRSNRWPNSSYFTHWVDATDSILWDVDVLHEDDYEVEIYYTCTPENVGCEIKLTVGQSALTTKISEAHDSEFLSVDKDRDQRGESFVKRFKPLKMGSIHLIESRQKMALTAPKIPGQAAIEFRLLMFERN